MIEPIEQRYGIKFCQKFGYTKVVTFQKIQQVFKDKALGPAQITQWLKMAE